MSRWTIEKSGTGIEKSGTGIEKSGTGIEKSGTGIEKSGTGIEKSGTGIRRGLLACTLAALACAGNVQAGNIDPAGSLQIVVNNDRVAVSWIIGDSVFSGVSTLSGSYANLMLTEVALSIPHSSVDVTGNGTGSNTQVTGNGTGSNTQVTGNGTGSNTQVTGNGTGSNTQVTGNGTGSNTKVTGNGTGSSTQVTGNGTGSNTQVTGNGTGSTILVTGNGTGAEAITITLPNGTGMEMEVIVGCDTAAVSVMDDLSMTVVAFTNVPVIGNSGFCGNSSAGGFGADFRVKPGRDFQSSD
jgi:hypothetical protein